ncbi:diguanylate cyclase [Spirochaetia bacterium]|nr:diguanylate cyclase [Spirochaetia bacterium]GHV88296.1 diguanylate cyclase [Spirochaetia bacterium]
MSDELEAALGSPIELLMDAPMFSGMSDLEFTAVTAFMERRRIEKGAVVFNEGDTGEELYILISGALRVFITQPDGGKCWLLNVPQGSFFGEMSVIAREPRSTTITAEEDSDVLVLQGIDFYRILYEHPMIGVKLLKAIGKVESGWLENSARHLNDLMRWGETARRRAITDELTGLNNRRFLEDSIKERFRRGSPGSREISLMMMDMDRVHEINETHGPQAGDRVISAMAGIIRSTVRSGDIAARLSGDEFAVLLPDTGEENAKVLAERIRTAVNGTEVPVPVAPGAAAQVPINIRASIGIAVAPNHASSGESLFYAADTALRKAKALGRDRVELAG